jgi:hypothetical protein
VVVGSVSYNLVMCVGFYNSNKSGLKKEGLVKTQMVVLLGDILVLLMRMLMVLVGTCASSIVIYKNELISSLIRLHIKLCGCQ